MTQGPKPIYFRPLFWKDLACKLGIQATNILWCLLILWLFISSDPPRYIGILVFSMAAGGYAFYAWRLYYQTVERRGLLRPLPFTVLFVGVLFVTSAPAHFFNALPSLGIAACFIVSAHLGDRFIRLKFPLWLKYGGRVNKYAGRVRRENRAALKKYPKTDLKIEMGGIKIPQQRAVNHCLYLGTTGSGKTLNMQLMLKDIVPYIGTSDQKLCLVFYDAKRTACPMLRGMNKTAKLYNMNFLHAEGYAWRINKDIKTLGHVRTLVAQLAPDQGASREDFWRTAMIFMLEGLTYFYTLTAPNDWTLRDVIKGTQSADRLFKILESHPDTARYAEMIRERGRLTFSVMCTIQTYLSIYSVIAALYDHAESEGRSISLKEFMEDEGILILGRDAEHIPIMSAINRLIFLRLSQQMLTWPDIDPIKATHHFVFDEFHTLGALPVKDLEDFITNVRSKGGSFTMIVQALGSLLNLYGPDVTYAILGQFIHKGVLFNADTITQRWISELVGSGERYRRITHKKLLGLVKWIEETTEIEKVPILPPENFSRFTQPDKTSRKGLTGFYMTGEQNYWHTYSSRYLRQNLIPSDQATPAFVPQDPAKQRLRPWDEQDLQRLKLRHIITPDVMGQHQQQEDNVLGTIQNKVPDLQDILRRYQTAVDRASQAPDDLLDDEDVDDAAILFESGDDFEASDSDTNKSHLREDSGHDIGPF